MDLVKLGKKGQLSLPAAVLRKLGIEGAAMLLIETTSDGAMVLRPVGVYPVEIYTDERLREFEDANRRTEREATRVRKALGKRNR